MIAHTEYVVTSIFQNLKFEKNCARKLRAFPRTQILKFELQKYHVTSFSNRRASPFWCSRLHPVGRETMPPRAPPAGRGRRGGGNGASASTALPDEQDAQDADAPVEVRGSYFFHRASNTNR
jgi:hypothetical protein